MAYSLSFALALGAGNTGLTLEAQMKNSAGANVGAAITTGFVEYGASGNYQWFTTAIPDGHIGGVVFQVSPGGAVKAFAAISPQEVENPDVKTSTRSSHTAADVWAAGTRTLTSFGTLVADTTTAVWAAGTRTLTGFGTLTTDTATAVWAVGTRTLTGFGTLVADVATAVWSAISRTLTSAAAPSAAVVAGAVWDEARAGHLTPGTFGAAYEVLRDGTAQAGGASTITLDAGAAAADGYYDNNILAIKAGAGAGQANIIESYVGATRVATMAGVWVTPPDNTSVFVILPLGTIPGATAPTTAAVAAAVWAYVTRTLTQAIAAVTLPPVITGDAVRVLRGETILLPFVNLGDISARTKLWLTVKGNKGQPDTAALLQLVEGTGLVILNRQAATAAEGSITVTDQVVGNFTARVEPAAAALLPPSDRYYYDVQMLSPAGVETLTSGRFEVDADVTRDIT